MPREMISLPHDVEYLSLLDKDLEPDLSDELLLAFLGHPTPISPPR